MAGRPSKYKPEHCDTLIKEMSQGLSYEAAVAIIGVDDSTACRWEAKHPEFRNAKKEAFAKNLVFWEKMGIAGALGKIKNFNATTWIFNMKNRHRWRDKHEIEVSEIDADLKDKSTEELLGMANG